MTHALLKSKDLLTLQDMTDDELEQLLQLALDLKAGRVDESLSGKSLAMIFDKPSTRTRVSFEVGMTHLGGHALYLNSHDLQIGRGETISDTAKVLSRYVDGLMIRTFSHETVETLAQAADIPVINGLTDAYHPCQVLADLLTIKETLGSLKGKKLAYVGDGNNMTHSLLIGAAKVGMHMSVATPAHYGPRADIVNTAKNIANAHDADIQVTQYPMDAVAHADVIYTDVWASMGDEDNDERLQAFQPYQVNQELLQATGKQPIFMHCLPAHRGLEVTAEVMDGGSSVVFDEAENRLHAQKALLLALLGKY